MGVTPVSLSGTRRESRGRGTRSARLANAPTVGGRGVPLLDDPHRTELSASADQHHQECQVVVAVGKGAEALEVLVDLIRDRVRGSADRSFCETRKFLGRETVWWCQIRCAIGVEHEHVA